MQNESQQLHLDVQSLGASGDGLVHYDGQNYYIPYSLTGEKLHLRLHNGKMELLKRENDSPLRVEAPCKLFEECGGCSLQHLALPALLDWKKQRVLQTLQHAGFEELPEVGLFQAKPHTRRRMDFALQRIPGGVIIGLHQKQGDPIDLTECTLLHPKIAALLPSLRKTLSQLGALTSRGSLLINLFDSGADLTLETEKELSATDKKKLADFAKEHAIPRITWRSSLAAPIETIVQWGPVFHHFNTIKISPPPASFLQATEETERAIAEKIVAYLPALNKKDRIVELYAGIGTFSFALAEKGHVLAYEGNIPAAQALHTASHQTKVTAFTRDLARQPLLPQDLKNTRVLVLDPPYNGAGKQIGHLVRSEIKDVIYVSCNPQALAKDLTELQKNGFKILNLDIIDQFLWSTEIETIVNLSRDPKRIKKAQKKS